MSGRKANFFYVSNICTWKYQRNSNILDKINKRAMEGQHQKFYLVCDNEHFIDSHLNK